MSGRLLVQATAGCLVCLAIGGCHSDVVPVSGRVTLNGKPLAGAVVTFQPHSEHGPRPGTTGSVGRTDEEGRFRLRLVEPDAPGAAVGEHSVTISAVKSGSDEAAVTGIQLPKAWSDGSQRFVVPAGGTTQADFKISLPSTSGRRK